MIRLSLRSLFATTFRVVGHSRVWHEVTSWALRPITCSALLKHPEMPNSGSFIWPLDPRYKKVPYVFLKFVFRQLWPVGCAGCTDLGCFWQTNLVRNLGSNYLGGQGISSIFCCQLSDELQKNIQYEIVCQRFLILFYVFEYGSAKG